MREAVPDATGCVIYWSIEKESLNLSPMMCREQENELRAIITFRDIITLLKLSIKTVFRRHGVIYTK